MFNTKTVGGIHNFQTGPDKQFIIEKMSLKPRIVPNFMRNMKTSFAHGNFKTEEREANSQNQKCEWFHHWVILGSPSNDMPMVNTPWDDWRLVATKNAG
jgi:hypothetical protein